MGGSLLLTIFTVIVVRAVRRVRKLKVLDRSGHQKSVEEAERKSEEGGGAGNS